jgi:hypothetical protein
METYDLDVSAPVLNVAMTAGDDLLIRLTMLSASLPKSITGWTFKAEIRNGQNNALITTLTIGAGFTVLPQVSPTIGRFDMLIPRTATAGLDECKKIIFDIETINEDSLKRRYLYGIITPKKGVTV